MARRYRKRRTRARGPQRVEKSQVLGGRVRVELPVTLAEVIGGVSGEIERLTGQAGLLIMKAVMDAEVESLAGPKSKHDPNRTATRWAQQPGYVVPAGKKVKVTKPRVRDKTSKRRNVKTSKRQNVETSKRRNVETSKRQNVKTSKRRNVETSKRQNRRDRVLAGRKNHKYEQAVEDFTDGYGISKSAVSRELVAATKGSLQKLCERRIDELGRLAVLLIDGKHLHGECVVVAMGVDFKGKSTFWAWCKGPRRTARWCSIFSMT